MAKNDDILFQKNNNLFEADLQTALSYGRTEDVIELLKKHQEEILNATNVSKILKAKELERVLDLVEAHEREANSLFISVANDIVSIIPKTEQLTLTSLADRIALHRRSYNVDLYEKVTFDIYQKLSSENKKTFRYKETAHLYRKRKHLEEGQREKAEVEKNLPLANQLLDDPNTPKERKFKIIEWALKNITEKAFGRIKSNEMKAAFCQKAIRVCDDFYPQYCAEKEYYQREKNRYQKNADQAKLHTSKSTATDYQLYMNKYRTDR